MADTATRTDTSVVPTELHIQFFTHGCVRFTGTAAQLIAEGLIPPGFVWPERSSTEYFDHQGFECDLRRCRPAHIKGPMRNWLDADWWALDRVDVSRPAPRIAQQQSPVLALVQECSAQLARRDKHYHAFRSICMKKTASAHRICASS